MNEPVFFPFRLSTILMDKWYNSFTSNLSLDRGSFQLIQPCVLPESDEELWDALDKIPPFSIKWNSWLYDVPSFFDLYATIADLMEFPDSAFAKVIGSENYLSWTNYYKKLDPKPPVNSVPVVFRQWAMINAPNIANIGSSDLSKKLLIETFKANIKPYLGPHAKPVDYQISLDLIKEQLASSSGASFDFDSSIECRTVGDTWIGDHYDPSYLGIWLGQWGSAKLYKKFSKGRVKAHLKFNNLTEIAATPGSWYSSSLLHMSWASQVSPPWSSSTIDLWDNFFGPEGEMLRAIGSIVMAQGISLSVFSDVSFHVAEQEQITNNIDNGSWPFYISTDPGLMQNSVHFDHDGKMTITIKSNDTQPAIIGMNVLPISQFFGASGFAQ